MKKRGNDIKAADLRRRAEKRLNEKQITTDAHPKDDDLLKLIHELQVHHIELEMQNEELMHARSEIEVLLDKYAGLYDFAPVGYFTLTDDGSIREVNLAGAALLGEDRSHLINRRFDRYVSAEAQVTLLTFYQEVFEGAAKATCEVTLARDKTDPRHIHLEGRAMESGQPSLGRQCLMVAVDVTALKRVEGEKKRLEIQLAQTQKMDSLGTFASGIAHDFNNILAAIFGYAELGMMDVALPNKVSKNLAGIVKASERARDLVRQILTFSKHAEKPYEPIMLLFAIKESLRLLRSMIPTHIEIHEDLKTSGMIMTDQTQIHQMMMNLCANAVQAMGEDGGVLGVSLEDVMVAEDDPGMAFKLNLPPGPYVKLSISDTGHGMSPEVIERIYEPYFTSKKQESGTGLGLAVVHGIVKKHRGSIICSSIPGAGTTFDIYLPRVEAEVNAVEAPVVMTLPTGTEHILWVDDEPDLVGVAQELLEALGYQVTATTSSTEALGLFTMAPGSFDLVVTDMTMPDIMGDRLARSILEIRPDMPIFLCTGFSQFITEEQAKRIGIREYFLKPFVMKDMARSIRKVLDNKMMQPTSGSVKHAKRKNHGSGQG